MMRDSTDARHRRSRRASNEVKVEVDYAGVPHVASELDEPEGDSDRSGQSSDEAEEEKSREFPYDGEFFSDEHYSGEPPMRYKRLTPEEHREFRRRALPLHIAEERFHKVFPPWSLQRKVAPERAGADCDVGPETKRSPRNTSGASFGETDAHMVDPQRMTDMVTQFTEGIKYADPGATGCLDIQLDLTSLGVPWLIVSLGLEGTQVRNSRTNCIEWKFRTNLGFNFKFFILGADFFFRVSLETSLELTELHCNTQAKDSFYCQYLNYVVQDYREASREKCHSDSSFDLILTYLKFQWQVCQNFVAKYIFKDKNSDYFGSPLERDLRAIRKGLLKYPALFRAAPVQPYQRMGDLAIRPTQVKVNGGKKWLWAIEHEFRLCWSKDKPKRPQDRIRTDRRLLELREACRESVELSEITPLLESITSNGQTVVIPLRSQTRPPIKIDFNSNRDAALWRRDMIAVMTGEWLKDRRLLSTRCVSASLHEKHDPYCYLDMPGEVWASAFHHNTRDPNWNGDGIGFHVDRDSHQNYHGEVIASVRDMDATWLEKAWEWFSGLWGGNDPLNDYIGEARVAVCSDNQAPRWVGTSELSNCGDKIAEAKQPSANDCKKTCLRVPGCTAIEYLHDGKCFFFYSTCGASLEEDSVRPGPAQMLSDLDPLTIQQNNSKEDWFDDDPPAMQESSSEEELLEREEFSRESWWKRRRRRRRAPPPSAPFRLVDRGCDIQASTAKATEITMPLLAIDEKSSGILWWKKEWKELKNTGNVKLTFQWDDVPEPAHSWSPGMDGDGGKGYMSYPGLVSVAQTMFAALDQYLGKIPDYTKQVQRRLKPYDPSNKQFEDGGLDYAAFDGRYGARWNPQKEEGEGEDEEEDYTCPPPDDASAHHELSCELSGNHDKKGSWWNKLKNRLEDMFTNPPCEGQMHEHDDRVVHFARGMQESKFSQNVATRVHFHAELTISMMNLLVRMVGDVQALFNVYFADEPGWDGNCYGLPSEFMLPYEFGVDVSDGEGFNWDPHAKDFSQTAVPERRCKWEGLVSEEGSKMPLDKNPFCKWTWSSSRKRQKHRVGFARQDAPINGRDNYVTAPREASAHMRPHIWCRVARAYRESQGDNAPFNVNNPNKSRTNLRYRSACQQIRLTDYGEKAWTAETRRRYECEDTILSPSFVTLFPKFLSKILGSTSPLMKSGDAGLDVGWFGEIGSIAEDILQCAGYVTAEMRQFQTTLQITDIDIDDLCSGGKEHLDSIVSGSGPIHSRIAGLVPIWSQKVLEKLREFADWLKEREVIDEMAEEFRDAFGYYDLHDHRGTMFTGEAWRAGLTAALDEMGTAEAIEVRIEESKDLAVKEAFKDKGGDAAGMFTLPMQTSITYSLSLGFAFELSNLCNLGCSAQLRMNVRSYIIGYTWQPYIVGGNSMLCVSGTMAPIHMFYLLVDTEFCVKRYRGGDFEYSWHIRLKSVIFEKNMMKDIFNNTVGKLYKKVTGRTPLKSDMTTGQLNNIIENAAWQLARKLLLDPQLMDDLVLIVAKATLDTIGETLKKMCDTIAHHVQTKIVPMAKEIANMAMSNALQMAVKWVLDAAMEAFDLANKKMGIVTVGVKLDTMRGKAGEVMDEWSRSAIVAFQRVSRLTIGVPEFPFIGQPGLAGLGFTFKFDQSYRYDFSAAFNSIMAGWGVVGTLFDCCTACLDDLGTGWCKSYKGAPKCFPYYGPNHPIKCDEPATNGPMFRYMDCAELGEEGKKGIDKSVVKECKAKEDDEGALLLRRAIAA